MLLQPDKKTFRSSRSAHAYTVFQSLYVFSLLEGISRSAADSARIFASHLQQLIQSQLCPARREPDDRSRRLNIHRRFNGGNVVTFLVYNPLSRRFLRSLIHGRRKTSGCSVHRRVADAVTRSQKGNARNSPLRNESSRVVPASELRRP